MVNKNLIPNLSIIVAVADNNAIGKDNDLLCHISDDLRHFKQVTSGHSVIMGRNTWNSLPRRPLPRRRNIVLTHDVSFSDEGTEVAHSINNVFDMIADEEETFIMGGAAVYAQFLPFVSKLYVTRIYKSFEADVFFPTIDLSMFNVVSESELFHDSESDVDFRYFEYERTKHMLKCGCNVLKYN